MAAPVKRKERPVRAGTQAGRTNPVAVLFGFALLVLPGLALARMGKTMDWRFLAGLWVVLCVVSYSLYRSDKRRAEAGEWRIPESTLHLFELLGGWPGAYLAQRQYRHKTAKQSYQVVYWLIVLTYQWVAGDFLADWKWSRSIVLFIKSK